MFAGLTITKYSGRILGTHQKVCRISRSALSEFLTSEFVFPNIKMLVHFEGKNGPDGIKLKSTGKNEPWHHYDPFDPEESELLEIIQEHYDHLVRELRNGNMIRAAFEASWLSHAILDGLTPSHHYPYEAELEKIRGESNETRTSYFKKVVMPGESIINILHNNWKMWGVKGLASTHYFFEMGSATLIRPIGGHIAIPNRYELKLIQSIGTQEYIKRIAREIAMFDMYGQFYKRGWSVKLANIVRRELAPRMAKTVTLVWYMAARDAGFASGEI